MLSSELLVEHTKLILINIFLFERKYIHLVGCQSYPDQVVPKKSSRTQLRVDLFNTGYEMTDQIIPWVRLDRLSRTQGTTSRVVPMHIFL
jgi:hypothetical protein